MDKRIAASFLALALTISLSACGASQAGDESANTTEAEPGNTYVGTVQEISEASITVATDDASVVIPLSDSTSFAYSGMGDTLSGADGQPSEMQEPPDGIQTAGAQEPSEGDQPEAGQESQLSDLEQAPGEAGEQPDDVPEMPDGEQPEEIAGGQAGEMNDGPDGTAPSLTWEDIAVGDTVTVVVGDDGTAESVSVALESMDGAPGGQSSGVDSYDAVNAYTEDTTISDTTLTSTGVDENTVHVYEGANVSIDGVTIVRESDNSTGGDNSSFYGVGAAALVTDGTLTIENSIISSDAAGGAGVFAYGDGTAYVSDTTITTEQDTSGGIHVAGGGTLYAWDLDIETQGESSAAIRSDRGSGTMVVDGGTYVSNGVGSPAVYSTADITVHNAVLTANGSEAICIEGLNTIRLFDCDLTGNMSDLSQNDCTWNVILYQSMSGDSEVGNSTFEMVGGTLTAGNGGIFYTTNTESTFILSGVDIAASADSEFFLKCTGNSNQRGWGTTGDNGADCHFTAISQVMEGDVIWDSISQLDFYMLDGSTLTGAFLNDESCAGSGGAGYSALYIDSSSVWVVTGDSVLTDLQCVGTIVDENGAAVTIQNADGTVYVQGSSQYTVTVESYSTNVDLSGASSIDSWNDFAVARG